ncbi:MAG: hypothetical protein WD602_10630 [Actinomycetota bacterium]
MRRKTTRLTLLTKPPATVLSSGAGSVVAGRALGGALLGLGAALISYYLFARHGDKIKEWIPKVTITREPEMILTDVHRNGHSRARLGGLGRL